MDVDEIRCKFQRGNNGDGRLDSGTEKMEEQFQDEEEEGENERGGDRGAKIASGGVGGLDISAAVGRFYGWPSSRIVRVSRASGGKDRHSKVLTSKGLRDRRVRLSVNTAIQFYDLQDRLGYDQPSKAVEWLLKAAASSISELPPITSPFPEPPNQLSDEKRSSTGGSDKPGFDSGEVEMGGGGSGGDPIFSHQFTTKSSACSSASETSKGSGLSLSRSESRIKARERAKERVAEKEKEKEKEKENASMNNNPISQTTSFTELLSGAGGGLNNNVSSPNNSPILGNPSSGAAATDSSFFLKSSKQWEYLCSGLLNPPPSGRGVEIQSHFNSPMFGLAAGDHQSELQQFSFAPDHLVQVVNGSNINANHHNGSSHEYNNLSFSISSSANSSGLAGFNRGTLQSNSSSPSFLPHHIQRFSDGSQATFFTGMDNHHQFLSGYDAAGNNNGDRHSAQRGRGKN